MQLPIWSSVDTVSRAAPALRAFYGCLGELLRIYLIIALCLSQLRNKSLRFLLFVSPITYSFLRIELYTDWPLDFSLSLVLAFIIAVFLCLPPAKTESSLVISTGSPNEEPVNITRLPLVTSDQGQHHQQPQQLSTEVSAEKDNYDILNIVKEGVLVLDESGGPNVC